MARFGSDSHEALVVLGLAPRSVTMQMLNIRRSNSWTLMEAVNLCLIFISWDIQFMDHIR